jgi:hypothetical protein
VKESLMPHGLPDDVGVIRFRLRHVSPKIDKAYHNRGAVSTHLVAEKDFRLYDAGLEV